MYDALIATEELASELEEKLATEVQKTYEEEENSDYSLPEEKVEEFKDITDTHRLITEEDTTYKASKRDVDEIE